MAPRPRTAEELLEIILDERVFTDYSSGCWLWRPGQWETSNGYGKVRFQGKCVMVHRFVFENMKGLIPEGQVLDHKCRRRACCNPEHLRPTTVANNTYWGLAVLFSKTY